MGHLRLTIVLLVLAAIAVHGKQGPHPVETDEAGVINTQVAQEAVGRAVDNPELTRAATRAAQDAALIESQGDAWNNYYMAARGSGLGRRFLREGSPHDPELLAQIAGDAAHAAVLEAVTTGDAETATGLGHAMGASVVNHNNLDAWYMRSGGANAGNRRLGERAARVAPADMQIQGTMMAQDAVRGMNAGLATKLGSAAAMANGAARSNDARWHLSLDEVPVPTEQGPVRGYFDWPRSGGK